MERIPSYELGDVGSTPANRSKFVPIAQWIEHTASTRAIGVRIPIGTFEK